MALFPCDWGTHRYPGPQRSMYLTLASDAGVETHKFRFCRRHFDEQMLFVREHFSLVDEDSQISATCESCHEPRALGVYVKSYQLNQEPESWATDLCANCAEHVADLLQIRNGRAMAAR